MLEIARLITSTVTKRCRMVGVAFGNHKKIPNPKLPLMQAHKSCKGSNRKFYRVKIPVVISTFLFGIVALSGTRWLSVAHMKGSGRDINNFIADVVDNTAQAVVMVEILNKNYFSGTMIPQSNGSGFIVKEDGLIITSAHVVMTGKLGGTVNVKLADNTSYQGVIEDIDMKADLATVRVNAKRKLPVIPLGADVDLRPGEWVIAIGSPLALSNTVTAGVVSTVHRHSHELKLSGKENMVYIQTDASLTFGNSGGPLVNLDGEVIGVNAMKVAPGISFAIPVRYVRALVNHSEKKSGKPRALIANPKSYIGVTMLSLSPQIVAELKAQNKITGREILEGVLIWRVATGSPAHSAGLQAGDIVTEMNDEKIFDTKAIYNVLENQSAFTLRVVRDGTTTIVNLKPEALQS